MRRRLAPMMLGLAILSVAGGACAMNSPNKQLVDCRVVRGELLPANSGGSDALCKAIRDAAVAQAPGKRFTVEVHVLSRSLLAATVIKADGTRLPEQKMANSDHELTKGSLQWFADVLVGELARSN